MVIRMIEPRDYEKLKALHAKAPVKYEIPDFEGPNFITGLVAVDEEDEPRILLCFKRTAEATVIVDHDFDVPAFRWVALGELIKAAKPLMVNLGYEDAIGVIGPSIPRSYLKRLARLGCRVFFNWHIVTIGKEG